MNDIQLKHAISVIELHGHDLQYNKTYWECVICGCVFGIYSPFETFYVRIETHRFKRLDCLYIKGSEIDGGFLPLCNDVCVEDVIK